MATHLSTVAYSAALIVVGPLLTACEDGLLSTGGAQATGVGTSSSTAKTTTAATSGNQASPSNRAFSSTTSRLPRQSLEVGRAFGVTNGALPLKVQLVAAAMEVFAP